MDQKGILVVSFGTTHTDTLEKTIAAIEQELAAAMPDRKLYRAFTSGMVRRRLAEQSQLQVSSPEEALEALCREGVQDLVIQPTHVLGGEEYSKLYHQCVRFRDRMRLSIGKPLLTTVRDYRLTCEALLRELPEQQDGVCHVFMGHGTEHMANTAYTQLEYMLHDMGRKDLVIGTVEGYPALNEVEHRLKERQAAQVVLRPLMVVAGDHAKNDLNGDGEASWRSVLEGDGYQVSADLRGLGEYPGIRSLFALHAEEAAEQGEEK